MVKLEAPAWHGNNMKVRKKLGGRISLACSRHRSPVDVVWCGVVYWLGEDNLWSNRTKYAQSKSLEERKEKR